MEYRLSPLPDTLPAIGNPKGKLAGKIALITGGDSGIGKAVALLFASEGADIAIAYLNEHRDARETALLIEKKYQRRCILIPGDLGREVHCRAAATRVKKQFGRIDILVNNAGLHYETDSLEKLSTRQLRRTFEVNIFSFFWLTKACLPVMRKGAAIINTSSVTAYRGSAALMDYAATKGAIISFTRSLAANLVNKGIRVNAVAPGPVWTPLIASSFKGKKVATHGSDAPAGRSAQSAEIAPSYLFLACQEDSGYITGQVLHPNGGEIING